MKLSAKDGQAMPVAVNPTGFNPWKFSNRCFAQHDSDLSFPRKRESIRLETGYLLEFILVKTRAGMTNKQT
ncbi:MAG: hypothetical protein PHP01_02400 [Phycisphaerae bacterium]|nr:hypothetical protein [Phycisphaerae bacterium]